MAYNFLRNKISRHFSGQKEIAFDNNIPSPDSLTEKFEDIQELGIYLHIPFCTQICPYCPYNKEIFTPEACLNYKRAVLKEIDSYVPVLSGKPVTSFYIGGGTPTTMLGKGLEEIINHIYKHFNMKCYVHMESHPNHLTPENLDAIEAMGVKYLSMGVEALQDNHLRSIERPYTVAEVMKSVERAVRKGFECVNIDYMFDLPGQTAVEVEQAAHDMVKLGVHQVATYPLFRFPYTRWGKNNHHHGNAIATLFRRRKLLKILEDVFYDSGYERSSFWAFTKKGIDKYCSVTVPLYVGLGTSGSSYLRNIFYVNTFRVKEYVNATDSGRSPIALSIDLSEEMQMSGWLYWRIYETLFRKSDFEKRFNTSFDQKFGKFINLLSGMGYLSNGSDHIRLTDKGTYWIHAFEDFFSIDYINKLWGTAKFNSWPQKVIF